mmetsp:Transcript_54327/g.174193  ORF Transcript_54327/g.174193 Transcript_54327/m.174193 type:complete len:318 (+) Transcript_54327:194-1147(+)
MAASIPEPLPDRAAALQGLTTDIEDDGTVELALLATEHPEIKRFGRLVFEYAKTANALSKSCVAWCGAGEFPEAALDAYLLVQATLGAMHKEIERLDSLDLSELRPVWGDKATVRMSRKSLYDFAEQIMARLDCMEASLAGPAGRLKDQRRERASQRMASDPELSLEEKYRDKFHPLDCSKPEKQPASGGIALLPAAADNGLPPVSKRQRTASVADVQELLGRLQSRIGQPLQRRQLQVFRRQLMNFAAIPNIGANPPVCRESIECALSAIQAALEKEPTAKAVGVMFGALQQIESLKDPGGLPPVLLDLADVIGTV